MANITELLAAILAAKKGEQVRGSIHDAIEQCYQDGKAGVNDLEGRRLTEQAMRVNEEQAAAIEALAARLDEIEGGGGEGGESQSTTIDVPTITLDFGSVRQDVAANASAQVPIMFAETFTEPPAVLCMIEFRNSVNTYYHSLIAAPIKNTVTTTGFTLGIGNKYTATLSPTVFWVAFEKSTVTIDTDITVTDGMSEAEIRAFVAPIQASLDGIKTGYDGTVYTTPGEAVREQINDLHVLIGDTPGTAIQASAVAYNDSNVGTELTNINGRLQQQEELTSTLTYIPITESDGYIDSDGSIKPQTSEPLRLEKYTNVVKVAPGTDVNAELAYTSNQWMWFAYALYNASGEFVRREIVPNSGSYQNLAEATITIPDEIYGIAFTYRTYGVATFSLTIDKSMYELSGELVTVASDVSIAKSNIVALNTAGTLLWDTKKNGKFLNSINCEVGSLNGTGVEVDSTTRIRSAHFSNSQTGLYVTPATGHMFGFAEYTATGYVWSGWKKVATEMPVGNDIRMLFDTDPAGGETADVAVWNDYYEIRTYADIRLITALQGDFISICHRGYAESGSDNYNLLPGYARAKKHGFDWCETDLKITSDGYLVCCHDNSFTDATTGDVITIADHTLAELQTYDYHGGQVPLLEDILKSCKLNGLGLVLDQLIESILDKTFKAVKAYGMQQKVAYLCGVKADAESVARSRIQAVLAHDPSARIFVTPTTKAADSLAVTICNDYQTATNRLDLSLNVTTHTPAEVKELSEELNNGTIVVYTTDVVSAYLSYVPYVTGITSNKVALSSLLIRG